MKRSSATPELATGRVRRHQQTYASCATADDEARIAADTAFGCSTADKNQFHG